MEKFLENPRNIEIQVFGDGKGDAVHLYDRDCSLQRRHQKIIEEAPSVALLDYQRHNIGDICVNICKKLKYRGAGTFEFLYKNGKFYFIEMNTRIQVEHSVTEAITNVDLIKEQIRNAEGKPLKLQQSAISIHGHSIECRINAENPFTLFPNPGKISIYHPPGGLGVRVDSHIYSQYSIPSNYDSMVAKVIVHASTRKIAIQRMLNALEEIVIDGIKTNIPLHQKILTQQYFRNGRIDINYLK